MVQQLAVMLVLLVCRGSGAIDRHPYLDWWSGCTGAIMARFATDTIGGASWQLNAYGLAGSRRRSGGRPVAHFRRDLLDRLLAGLSAPNVSVNLAPYESTVDFNPRQQLVLIVIDQPLGAFARTYLPRLVAKNVEFRGYFLLLLPSRPRANELRRALERLWWYRIYNVVLLVGNRHRQRIQLITYRPYGPGGCCECIRPLRIGQCVDGQLQQQQQQQQQRDDAFPYARFERNFYGCRLRIASFERVPFMQFMGPEADGSGRLGGIEGRLLGLLAGKLNFSASIVPPPDDGQVWGRIYPNGSADGALRLVLDGSAHLALGGYFPYPALLASTTQSYSYYISDFVLAVPEAFATASGPFEQLLKPFRWPIWTLIGVELAVGLGLWPVRALDQWRALLGDSLPRVAGAGSGRVRPLLALWLLHALVLRESYKGSLVGYLTAAAPLADISSLRVLVAAGYHLAMTEELFHQVFEGRAPPRLLLFEPGAGPALLERILRDRERTAAVYTREEIIAINQRDRATINFRLSDEKLLSFHFSMYFKRSSPLAGAFNWYIRRVLAAGFVSRWHADTLDRRFLRPTLATDGQSVKVLTLAHLASAYLLLAAGLLAATVAFTLELGCALVASIPYRPVRPFTFTPTTNPRRRMETVQQLFRVLGERVAKLPVAQQTEIIDTVRQMIDASQRMNRSAGVSGAIINTSSSSSSSSRTTGGILGKSASSYETSAVAVKQGSLYVPPGAITSSPSCLL
uniref:Putative ionotropic receptor ligand binding domain-containing protein n=1 Tax=Anopheles albimanus TaxID=7167 RepID=A0A182FIC9_ANOAL